MNLKGQGVNEVCYRVFLVQGLVSPLQVDYKIEVSFFRMNNGNRKLQSCKIDNGNFGRFRERFASSGWMKGTNRKPRRRRHSTAAPQLREFLNTRENFSKPNSAEVTESSPRRKIYWRNEERKKHGRLKLLLQKKQNKGDVSHWVLNQLLQVSVISLLIVRDFYLDHVCESVQLLTTFSFA